jgi:hypothetical protein
MIQKIEQLPRGIPGYIDHTLHTLLLILENDCEIVHPAHANPRGVSNEDFSLYNRLYARLRTDGKYDVFVDDRLIVNGVRDREGAEAVMDMLVDKKGILVEW